MNTERQVYFPFVMDVESIFEYIVVDVDDTRIILLVASDASWYIVLFQ